MPAKSAGSSITVTCASARLRSAAATLTTPIRGNGLAGSTPAAIRESTKRAPPKRSTRPAVSSKRHGQCFHRSELRPTFRNGAISGIGRLRNIAASIEASACRVDETPAGLETTVRRSHPPARRSPSRDAGGRRQLCHQATESRSRGRRVAGCDGSLDPGGDAGRPNDVCAHRCHAGTEPPRRTGVQFRSQRHALGKAEAGSGSMRDGTMSGLTRIPNSRRTSRHVRKVPKAEVYPQQSVQPATRHPSTWVQQRAPRRLGTTRTRTDADGTAQFEMADFKDRCRNFGGKSTSHEQWPANILAEEFQPAEDVDVAPDGGEVEAIARANIAVCGITIVQSNIDGNMLLDLGR